MKNFYDKVKMDNLQNPEYGRSHVFKPNKHILIIGKTGSGKSNVLLNLIERMKGVFINIILCTKDASEPLYVLLREMIPNIKIYEGDVKNEKGKLIQNTPDIEDINEQDNKGFEPSLIIFDDCVADKDQQRIGQYFIRGRKRNVTCVYLSQGYYATPKIIRQQCNNLLLKQGIQKRDLNAILRETSLDYDIKDLVRIYNKTIKQFGDFLNIDLLNNDLYIGFDVNPFDMNNDSNMNDDRIEIVNGYKSRPQNMEIHVKQQSIVDFIKTLHEKIRIGGISKGEYMTSDLYSAYKDWCEMKGYDPHTKNALTRIIRRTFPARQTNNGYAITL